MNPNTDPNTVRSVFADENGLTVIHLRKLPAWGSNDDNPRGKLIELWEIRPPRITFASTTSQKLQPCNQSDIEADKSCPESDKSCPSPSLASIITPIHINISTDRDYVTGGNGNWHLKQVNVTMQFIQEGLIKLAAEGAHCPFLNIPPLIRQDGVTYGVSTRDKGGRTDALPTWIAFVMAESLPKQQATEPNDNER